MAETDEAMRLIIELGRGAFPMATEVVKFTAAVMTPLFGAGLSLARGSSDMVLSNLNWFGSTGVVRRSKLRGRTQFLDLTEAFESRADCREIKRTFKKFGIGFRPLWCNGRFYIEYSFDDREKAKLALESIFEKDVVEQILKEARDEAVRLGEDPERAVEGALMEAALGAASKEAVGSEEFARAVDPIEVDASTESFECGDLGYRRTSETEFAAPFTGQSGNQYHSVVSSDGSWRIETADGRRAVVNREVCEGAVEPVVDRATGETDLGATYKAAAARASLVVGLIKDGEAVRHHKERVEPAIKPDPVDQTARETMGQVARAGEARGAGRGQARARARQKAQKSPTINR